MATNRERYQNPVVGDTIRLRLNVYNSNNLRSVDSIDAVEIYYLDPEMRSESNPDGRILVETIAGGEVTETATGQYLLEVLLDGAVYTEVGNYIDVWFTTLRAGDAESRYENHFTIYADLWYATPIPVVYDFDFHFLPNQFIKGSKVPIEIQIEPNVPRATDLEQYYLNLAIVSDLKVSIWQRCGDCLPCEEDLRTVVEDANTDFRERCRAYYTLDTEEMDCGVYDIQFKLLFGGNRYLSPRFQIVVHL